VDEVSLTDERLCWLAVRDQLNRKLRGSMTMVFLAYFRGSSRGKMISGRMAYYAEAVDELAGQLSAEERRTLRLTKQVPAWFLPRVEDRATELRKAY
jgi:hypothetical protein